MTERDQPARGTARVLIVDDEPLNVDYLEQELESCGFLTESAANGVEALARVAESPPDIVLLDVMMPELDGISTLRVLKSDPETRLIPVVLMTALNAVEDRVRGIEAGADDFLSKPVDDRELLARIRTALAQKRAIDETVDELRSTSAHLDLYGRQEREVAVLAAEWRQADSTVPEAALDFVSRRARQAIRTTVREFGGTPSERTETPLVAVFEASSERDRATVAVEAARAIVDRIAALGQATHITVAIAAGSATVGSTRASEAGTRWIYGANGPPVDRALALVRETPDAGIVVTEQVAVALARAFELEVAADGAYRLLEGADASMDAAGGERERRVATILVTDIVGSTSTIERIGDDAWLELIEAHERAIRQELVVHGGIEVDTAGDGFLASFDSPTQAIRCALSVVRRSAELQLAIRAGIHTGELEDEDGAARGMAVHIASRVSTRAGSGEILVSATTREIASGAGLIFTDRGEHPLKGVTESRRLYAVTRPESGDLATAAADLPAHLTAREVDVLRLVAVGLSDAEVAKRLFLSVRTVNAHLRSIYRKIGVRSRAAAGRFAEENDLL